MSGAPHVGIVELGSICDRQAGTSRLAFEALGEWVTVERDPALQRLWAIAAHRYAWHAELWRARLPAIPPLADDGRPPTPPPDVTAPHVTAPDARGHLDDLATRRADLAALRSRLDPDLDPSTLRVVDLVDADLADLEARLTATLR